MRQNHISKTNARYLELGTLKNRPRQSRQRGATNRHGSFACQIVKRNATLSYPELKQHLLKATATWNSPSTNAPFFSYIAFYFNLRISYRSLLIICPRFRNFLILILVITFHCLPSYLSTSMLVFLHVLPHSQHSCVTPHLKWLLLIYVFLCPEYVTLHYSHY